MRQFLFPLIIQLILAVSTAEECLPYMTLIELLTERKITISTYEKTTPVSSPLLKIFLSTYLVNYVFSLVLNELGIDDSTQPVEMKYSVCENLQTPNTNRIICGLSLQRVLD